MTDRPAPADPERRRFLVWMARLGAFAVTLPVWPGVARAVRPAPFGDDVFPETARAWRVMGTLIEVRVPDLPPQEAVEAIRRVRARVETLEAAMTLFRPESPLVAWNRHPEGRWLDVPGALCDAVTAALRAADRTDGAFDPTVAPGMRAWGLYGGSGRDPGRGFLRAWVRRPGVAAVEMDEKNRRLRRLDARVELDLGGVGKGIAVDAALSELRAAGSRAALVNLGGEIGVLGAPPAEPDGWTVGIADPFRPGELVREFALASGHVATSGNYERWVETPRGRRHHLLDPATGDSAAGVASVTARAATGLEADVLSTTRFVQASRGQDLSAHPDVVLHVPDR